MTFTPFGLAQNHSTKLRTSRQTKPQQLIRSLLATAFDRAAGNVEQVANARAANAVTAYEFPGT